MKFSHSLQFNAVPEWSSKYLAYSSLKKLIYSLQKQTLIEKAYDDEQAALLRHTDPIGIFTKALDKDLLKIDDFYKTKENEVFGDYEALLQDIEEYQHELQLKTDILLGDSLFDEDQEGTSTAIYNNNKSVSGDDKLKDIVLALSNEDLLGNDEDRQGSVTHSHRPSFSKLSSELNARNDLLSFRSPEIYGDANEESEDEEDEEGEDEDDDDRQEHSNLLKHGKSKNSVTKSDGTSIQKKHSLEHTTSTHSASAIKQSLINSVNLKDSFLVLSDIKITLKKRLTLLFTALSDLKSYIELNKTGFKKILKKFDKTLQTTLKDEYMNNNLINNAYVFKDGTIKRVSEKIKDVIGLYADIATNGSVHSAETELKLHLREHVVWERNTVWRDMINIERKSQAANIFSSKKMGSSDSANSISDKKELNNNLNNLKLSSLFNGQWLKIGIIFAILALLLVVSPFQEKEQRRCFSLLICASLLWATEAFPLFVTSLAVPLAVIVMKVLKYDDPKHKNYGKAMEATDASKFILGSMWSSVIMLLLGGFTLAAALSKHSITRILSTMILSKSGTNPSAILLTTMLISLFVSAVVSNVAAPVLCYSIIQPLLRTLPTSSNFAKALILGVAFASNLGGMSSPISSPQNIIAIELMEPQPSWIQWFIISIPVCLIALVAIWIFLLISFKITGSSNVISTEEGSGLEGQQIKIVPIQASNEKFTPIQWYIIVVSVVTILLWCFANNLSFLFGEIGVISFIPIILFFGSSVLTSEDWNNFLWTIVALAMGGIALGKAVSSSGLLKTIAVVIQEQVIVGLGIYQVCLIFGLLCLVISTFISHTVSALILLPLIKEIGQTMTYPIGDGEDAATGDYSRLLVMVNVLLCSIAMGLPTSGFPNVTAICMTDEVGHNYVNVKTFITRGVPSSLVSYFVIVTVGYLIMQVIHF